ncbi:Uip4p [Kluyveromyces lactis]|uniref:KLLA0E19053p n=1 Tax=Kluyveromyces lactis (strain ATCC 8585 / CBS 2359 / DSM 70799 / NBRC 1267 / NRRL Y-1140 / WM37) TaxID=284590 RepID=Q6CMM6_KLULA|nr:uncharacterized protein KLLA0_E19053g [Kluyveromyces lactis]CAG99900.1 KLLA0E19053p [Kluyveromyces lactis]|eukprot:XP_454813.1 uncharacterized protein KLLA0_E19053g [Kluyveromyces lactis]
MKIISKRDSASGLNVALDLEKWTVKPMIYNVAEKQWEYTPDLEDKEVEKIHFKFVDSNGTWFADNDFPKEFDNIGNENNVIYVNGKGLEFKNYVNDIKNDADSPASTPKNARFASPREQKPEETTNSVKKEVPVDEGVQAVETKKDTEGSADKAEAIPAQEQLQEPQNEQERPTTSDTAVTHRSDSVVEYSTFLDRIMLFLRRFIKKWFTFERSSSPTS